MAIDTIREIEQAMIDKLQTYLTNHKIEPYPDSPDNFEFTHRNGGVLVKYNSSNFGTPNMMMQSRTAEWNFVVWARSLRKPDGIYELMELVRKYMSSLQPKCFQVSEGFIMHEDAVWQYGMTFRAEYYYIMGD